MATLDLVVLRHWPGFVRQAYLYIVELGSTSSIAAGSSIAPNEGLNPIVRTGDAKSLPAQGLRLLEHGTRAF
jgi:hypothetical protein